MKTASLFLLITLAAAAPAWAANENFRNGPERASLLELYTSEGCWSCTDADRWLGHLKDDKALWNLYVPVAFHVDYWNHLGWTDALSKPEFSERQRNYASTWKGGEVYTPAFVLDGQDWRKWYRADAPPHPSRVDDPGELELKRQSGEQWRVAFRPVQKELFAMKWTAHVALLGFDVTTDVRSGENAGKRLRHDFVVLSLRKKTMVAGGPEQFAIFHIPKAGTWRAKRYGIACWVTHGGRLEPLQAVGGYLEEVSQ